MRNASYILFTLFVALLVGFGSAFFMLENGRRITAQQYGAWIGWVNAGGADTDPYHKAGLARTGALQLGRAEGLVFSASQDDNGDRLDGKCSYLISGSTPRASIWTLRATEVTSNDPTIKTPNYLTSLQVNRHPDGGFDIIAAPQAQPGNWLNTMDIGKMKFTLSFYDTNAFLVVGHESVVLPTVQKVSCS
ncbi:DUF1214 domain-containing protein [Maritalea porphyrae]|jgi:hypothetical protein|uniref:DUF1214 domain-containing protein n=1 Tax=Maritalea porphyrae TaxID=880732 RepID=UPI0022AE8B28|nr:DUF1214 domain-containing protein [Maritalea porphyrae]MCZ4271168.1 DUF1214 domain-containing protein [Maritalea porphyrae]